jgi:hypothetical protein
MGFSEDGFLSSDLKDWTTTVPEQLKDWFDLVYDVNRETMKALFGKKLSLTNNQQLMASRSTGGRDNHSKVQY